MELIDKILTEEEKERLLAGLNREPTRAELAMISAMWSEHCSYKHSRYFLRNLPQKSDRVLAGPGENAGIIKISEDLAIAFKIESHNHPSAVVPYQGAATGVGGILRDIFTMGAKPIALLNSLHFDLSDKRGKFICEHVIEGIADYGNCTGIPTVAGEFNSYHWFKENPLVNVVCVGKIHPKRVTMASTAKPGDLVLYFGNKTGTDGAGGAIFASLNLTDETREQKSAVQVADPFMGKLIMEASLELIEKGIPSAMQDMGASGITCSTSEIAHSSGLGILVEMDNIPVRAPDITPEEILLSESQERMLATIPPDKKEAAQKILDKYPLDYAWVGEIKDYRKIEIHSHGEKIVDMPLELLISGCPIYSYEEMELETKIEYKDFEREFSWELLLEYFKISPQYASKRYIYEQFDHEINLRTLSGPGQAHTLIYDIDTKKVITILCQSRSDWTGRNAYRGTLSTLMLAIRASFASGANPLGLSNCLNFPSPEKEVTMQKFGQTTRAMREVCEAFDVPVTGGNVSFYNESENSAIPPTPVFIVVGESILKENRLSETRQEGKVYITGDLKFQQGEFFANYLIKNDLSLDYLNIPELNLEKEKKLGNLILDLYKKYSDKIWIKEIGKGGIFKRFVEFFGDSQLDLVLSETGNWQDLLFGEGKESYLIFVPKEFVSELESELKENLEEFGLREIGEAKKGEGYLVGFQQKVDLNKYWEWAQESLHPFLELG